MNRSSSTWQGLDLRAPWATPDVDQAPVCFVIEQPGDLRSAHVVCPADDERLVDAARELMAVMLKRQAVHVGEPIGEGRTYVLHDGYAPGWHIVVAQAPRVDQWTGESRATS